MRRPQPQAHLRPGHRRPGRQDAGRRLARSTRSSPAKLKYGGNQTAAQAVGKAIAERAIAAGIKQVGFDRGPYKYHGRVAALADAAREARPAVLDATSAQHNVDVAQRIA